MKIEQIYTGCLAQGAYYIESRGEAAIIDPLREVQPYLDRATKNGAAIKYIFETHFHADFVSGHVDLSQKTGAPIVYGPTNAQTGFEALIAADGQEFTLGDLRIRLIHTPGHTMESSCYLLIDESGKETALFTGDTLFIGDVGRPDLVQLVIADLTAEKLAGHLYDSLQQKIMPLSDDIIIYPGHGAGSACGKNMSNETTDTLGNQKLINPMLRAGLGKEQFIKELIAGQPVVPGYFPQNVLMNINGYAGIDEVMARGNRALSPAAFEIMAEETDALILDTRSPQKFVKGFIPGAVNIGLDGNFAVWVGTLITDIQQKILLITEPGKEEEAVTRLARVGYDHAMGYLQGGMQAWTDAGRETDFIPAILAGELAEIASANPNTIIIDARRPAEYDAGHMATALNLPLETINNHMQQVEKDKTAYVHCLSGYRSVVFVSILRNRGYRHLVNVAGGFNAIRETPGFMWAGGATEKV